MKYPFARFVGGRIMLGYTDTRKLPEIETTESFISLFVTLRGYLYILN